MKKKTIMLWLLCLFTAIPFGAKAQRTLEYSLAFSKTDFSFQSLNGDTSFITSTKYDVYSDYDPLQPDLPVIYVSLLLPPDASYAGMSFTSHPVNNRTNTLLTNGHAPATTDMSSLPDNNQWYPSQTYYESVEFASSSIVGGYRTVTLKVKPCRYYSARKILFFFRFDITIQLNDADEIPLRTSTRGARERSYVESKIWNKEALDSYEVYPSASQVLSPGEVDILYRDRYIVITNNELKESFLPLLKWKEQKGLETTIITVEEIDTMPSLIADTGVLKIKHYLKQEFENTPNVNEKDLYVLLGGDADIVPIAYCDLKESFLFNTIPSDMYYACVSDDSTWTWRGEDGNLLSWKMSFSDINDLYVSRASVRTPEQVSVFINKVIQYEINPPLNWGDKMLFLGETILTGYSYSIPRDDEVIGKAIIADAIESSRQSDVDYLYSTDSNIYTDAYYMSQYHNRMTFVDSVRVSQSIQGDYAIVNEMSHGDHTNWGYNLDDSYETQYIYTYSQAQSANSIFPKIIVSTSCDTNGFDSYNPDNGIGSEIPSLSEILMRNPNSGIVGYIGNTRQGWGSSYLFSLGDYIHMSYKVNHRLMRALYSSEMNDTIPIKNLGKVAYYAKSSLIKEHPYERAIMCSVNTLGDPEMPLYTETPKTFDNINSVFNGDTLFVISNDSSAYDVLLHLYYGANDEEWYRSVTPVIENIAGIDSFDVVLLRQNYIPQITRYYSSKFIQNKTLTETDNVDGEYQYIYVGRNVTDKKPVGNVTVGSGKTVTLKAQKGVYIKNGFTNPLGSTFEIDIVQPNETNNNP